MAKERNYMAEGRKLLFWVFALGVTIMEVGALFACFVRDDYSSAFILLLTATIPAYLWGHMWRWYVKNGWWT